MKRITPTHSPQCLQPILGGVVCSSTGLDCTPRIAKWRMVHGPMELKRSFPGPDGRSAATLDIAAVRCEPVARSAHAVRPPEARLAGTLSKRSQDCLCPRQLPRRPSHPTTPPPSPRTSIPLPHNPPPRVTFRRVVVSLRGPGQSPVLLFACCVGSLRSVGRCGCCSCWCRFRVRGAQSLVCRGCAECGGMCRLHVSSAQ